MRNGIYNRDIDNLNNTIFFMKKIPLEILSLYLPYAVKAKFKYTNDKKCKQYVIGTVNALYDDGTIVCHDTVNATPDKFKLVLRPIESCSIAERLSLKNGAYKYAFFSEFQDALKKHIDIFGLIEKGLAVEK